MVEPAPLSTLDVIGAVACIGALLLAQVLSGLLHRSGSIRLRHWAQEAGGRLHDLHRSAPAFEAFRLLFAVLSHLALLSLFLALHGLLARLPFAVGSAGSWALAVVATLLFASLHDLFVRRIVAVRSEESLERLLPIYRIAAVLLAPLVALLRPLMPMPTVTRDFEEDEVSEGKLDAFIEVGQREGIIEAAEGELVRGVVEFGDTQVRSVMTPRVDVVCAQADAALEVAVRLAIDNSLSRLPVYEDSIDHIIGVVHSRDLLRVLFTGEPTTLRELAMPPHFVPQTKRLAELLKELQELHQALAIVVDEYGGTEGIVSLEDILEEIFGEIVDEHDSSDPEPEQLEDGSWRVGGQTHTEELEELVGVRIEEAPYETVGGLIFGALGRVPQVGDAVTAHGLAFEVDSVAARRVHTARVRIAVREAVDVDA